MAITESVFNLADLDGDNGFRLEGVAAGDSAGISVSGAGDVNGDGFEDLIVAARLADPNGTDSGSNYVVFGQASGFSASINLDSLDGNSGFRLDGVAAVDHAGISVSGVGDVNGDGYDDVMVGAYLADPNGSQSGSSYVVFGQASGFSASIDLDSLDGTNGFRLDGVAGGDAAGVSVSGAGDVNGDGYDDVIVGAYKADPNGIDSGASYVVFGQASGFPAPINLDSLDGTSGFRLEGVAVGDNAGRAVSGAGDINGDGFDDLIIGANLADPNGIDSGASYVVFGQAGGYGASVNLASLDGSSGFRLEGVAAGDAAGFSVRGAGDVNGDGYDDLIMGAQGADTNGADSGASYVVFGKSGGYAPSVNLASLDGSSGFRLEGVAAGDNAGNSVSGAGDINGDGFDDLVVGAWLADPNGSQSGSSYVFYGQASGYAASVNLASLDGSSGFRLDGVAAVDRTGISLSGAGDVNNDGFDDLLVGAYLADSNGDGSGASYVVFGGGSSRVFNNAAPTGEVTIAGDATAGKTLTASNSLSDADGASEISYQWRADGSAIAGATGSQYLLRSDDLGKMISVTASFLDGLGVSESVSSSASEAVVSAGAVIQLADLDGNNGFRLDGSTSFSLAGSSVSNAGDINGDGFDDLIVGARQRSSSFVVFGKAAGFTATSDLADLDGSNGFRLIGTFGSAVGDSVSGAGDINGDGFDDLIVGASRANYNGDLAGASYVVFGQASGYAATVELASLDGSSGFRLEGVAAGDNAGYSVSGAGDINGDGFDDLVVGAWLADPNGSESGSSYVFYGQASGYATSVNLASLDGSSGFRLDGVATGDAAGFVVSDAGDVNGDGYDDLIVGTFRAAPNGYLSGSSYVVFGMPGGYPGTFSLADLDGSNGFRLDGPTALTTAGRAVSRAGDVNGDGYDDLIVGGEQASPNGLGSGASYVVFGKAGGYTATFNLADLDGNNGFRLEGVATGDRSGFAVSGAGDVNADGYDDLIVGAFFADPNGENSGASYVVYGRASGYESTVNLASLDGNNGFRLEGVAAGDNAGGSVSGAGDINGDGFDDLIVGAEDAAPNGQNSGSSYVVFGGSSNRAINNAAPTGEVSIAGDAVAGETLTASNTLSDADGSSAISYQWRADGSAIADATGSQYLLSTADLGKMISVTASYIDGAGISESVSSSASEAVVSASSVIQLADLDGNNGFRLEGVAAVDRSGFSVSGAGDINGDGIDDLIVGAYTADPNGVSSGASYVVFGKVSGFAASINLDSLDGSSGFRLDGAGPGNISGYAVSGAGDVNGDGLDDLIVGAISANNFTGSSYVVFGQASGFSASINLASLDGNSGFRLDGVGTSDSAGGSVSGAGDINGDGFGDLIVGAFRADLSGSDSGASYVVFGKAGDYAAAISLADLNGSTGFRLDGVAAGDRAGQSVSGAGDVNGDGFDDMIIGAPFSSGNGNNSGASYVVFGQASGFSASIALDSLDGNSGFYLQATPGVRAGLSVSGAGDVNGDGYDDVIVGAQFAGQAGASYVVFGKAGGFGDTVSLDSLDGSSGFRLDGVGFFDNSGVSVSGAGDVNGDGFDDLIVGAWLADPNGADSGSSYVVFGKAGGFIAAVSLASLDRSSGFRLDGVAAEDSVGYSVSGAGDVNSDGFDDLIVGAYLADPNGDSSGASYVVFGGSSSRAINNAAPTGEVFITGDAIAGETLTASNTLSDADGSSAISYQWRADGSAIAGATGSQYLLSTADLGKMISVTASYIDGAGISESVHSSATELVVSIVEGGPENDFLTGSAGADTIRGFGGRDTLEGLAGNDLLEGGDEIDQAVFHNDIMDYSIVKTSTEITVIGPMNDGTDTLKEIERLHFNDVSLAFDLDGNAGDVAKLFGVLFGTGELDPNLNGIALEIFDNYGLTFEQVMEIGLEVVLGTNAANADVMNLIFVNLIGLPPSDADLNALTASLLDSGDFTQAGLAVFAADLELNAENIGLVGLAETGFEYSPTL